MSHLNRVKTKLPEGCALVVTSNINQRWLTGFDYTDGFVIVTKKSSYLITDFRYIEAAQAQAAAGFEVIMPKGTMHGEIAARMAENEVKTVMIEEATLSVSGLERLKKALPELELTNGGSKLLDGIRRFKDCGEVEKMKRAQALTDAAFEHMLGNINTDRTETDIALELEFFMRSKGAEGTAFETIAVSGSASSMPHGVPRPVKLERGFLTMDFGAKVDGYCSDMTRTVVIGRADDEMKRLYGTVLEAQQRALEAVFNGERSCFKLDKIARDIINDAGYRDCFGHSLGHGVGMYIHEAPRLSQYAAEDEALSIGDVVTFEPGIYLSGKYGCRIEDMVYIGENGCYDFTQSPKQLIEL